MATNTLADIDLESAWEDLVATHAAAASVEVRIQNVGGGPVAVVAGGAAAPNGKTGALLAPTDSVQVNAANVWMRATGSAGRVSVTLV